MKGLSPAFHRTTLAAIVGGTLRRHFCRFSRAPWSVRLVKRGECLPQDGGQKSRLSRGRVQSSYIMSVASTARLIIVFLPAVQVLERLILLLFVHRKDSGQFKSAAALTSLKSTSPCIKEENMDKVFSVYWCHSQLMLQFVTTNAVFINNCVIEQQSQMSIYRNKQWVCDWMSKH